MVPHASCFGCTITFTCHSNVHFKHTLSIPASTLGASGATILPEPGPASTRLAAASLPRLGSLVGQKPLLHGPSSRIVAQGSTAADHSVTRDEDGDLKNRGHHLWSGCSHDRSRLQWAGCGPHPACTPAQAVSLGAVRRVSGLPSQPQTQEEKSSSGGSFQQLRSHL